MNNKIIIQKNELFYILINLITTKMFFTYPRYMVNNSGNAAWIQCIYVSLIYVIIYTFTLILYKKASTVNILDASEFIGGKLLKRIVGILLSIILILNIAVTIRALPESIKTVLLPLTPMKLLMISLGIAIALGAYAGLYSLARICSLFMPVAAVVFVFLLLLLIPDYDITNIYPIFGKGTYNIFISGLSSLGIFSDTIILFILLPFFRNYSEMKAASTKALTVGSLISFLIVFIYNLIFSYPASEDFMMPIYQISRLIKIGDFFQRFEAFFEFVWSISIMLYASIYLFVICYIWKEIFDLKYYKELIFPFTVIIISLSYLPSSTVQLSNTGNIISVFTIPLCIFLPAIIALSFRIKNHIINNKKILK